ncbi:MAG: hypothetical protein WBB28_19185 [Crinalium sp.]
MAKILLQRILIPATELFRKQGGRTLATRLEKNANVSKTVISGYFNQLRSKSDPTESVSRDGNLMERLPNLGPWSILWLSVILLLGGTGLIGMLVLTTLPPLPNCQQISPMATDSERLYCAQMDAESGSLDSLVKAVDVVKVWPENHPLYNEAQRMMGNWSQNLLAIAQNRLKQGNLKEALAIAGKIPGNSLVYPQAQAAMKSWQGQWQQAEDLTSQFQQAVKSQNWSQAWKKLEFLLQSNYEYWRSSKHAQLTAQLAMEKQAWQQLQEAQDLAKYATPEQLTSAIALVAKVDPKSYIKGQAQAEKQKWSRSLLDIAASSYKSSDFASVISVAQGVPADVSVYPEAQDWIHLSRAASVAVGQNPLAFLDALSAVRQIQRSSPLYKEATAKENLWKSHLKDQIQLQVATAVASFDQPMTLNLALEQAQQIGIKRPGRIESQTLIASWRKAVQQIEDRSTLATARQLAQRGTLASLQTAISNASKITVGQPLHSDAQTEIAQWNKQIEVIEDRPILDLARAFATNGDLNAAVETASKISYGRALSSEAQVAINGWVTQIQIAQDQPLIDAANALAAQGRFGSAILTASQIRPGRALYDQAQAAISRWQTELPPPPRRRYSPFTTNQTNNALPPQ